jgi:cytosine/adenosine deaminase-related metal-dependent hydrolase
MKNPVVKGHKKLFRGAWVVPMSGPALRDGGVVVCDGRVLELGPFAELVSRYPSAELIDRSTCTILPGLVNAHTHLELSEFTRGPAPAGFTQWLTRLVPQGQVTAQTVKESVARSIPLGVEQCLRFGVTCVGDISRHSAVSRPLLAGGPIRVVSYGEVQAMAQRRGLLEERIATAADAQFADPDFLRIAISPHAPYSIEADGYRRCIQVAQSLGLPLATHLAETPDEASFLAEQTGPFRDLWSYIGVWDEHVPRIQGGPIRFAREVGLLDYPTLLAHVNYCDDAEMELLAGSRVSVVYCPRTHSYFGHPPHRWRQMLARGINVALGTDSSASSPDLNLIDEMRVIRRLEPDVKPSTIWEMTTIRAAQAVQMDHQSGSLEAGKRADFAVFKTRTDEPLAEILDAVQLPIEVWVGGKRCSP